jgi:hypothetical protein
MTLKLSEYRTSKIDNKSELECENAIMKRDYKKLEIKEIYNLEKLKEKNQLRYDKKMLPQKIHKILTCKTSTKLKYMNRDNNAVRNMLKIVSSYIEKNYKPMIYVMGTKICNNTIINDKSIV